jgi:pimeloyl-ACP methyl ester carboxylesterase
MSTNEATSQTNAEHQSEPTIAGGTAIEVDRSVQGMAALRLCFDKIEAKRVWAIDQRRHFNKVEPDDPDDAYAYEYYDGMVDAYARAMAILEEHIKEEGS